MSKKWNIFKKKVGKTDSHGSTSANEEILFQITARSGFQWGNPGSSVNNGKVGVKQKEENQFILSSENSSENVDDMPSKHTVDITKHLFEEQKSENNEKKNVHQPVIRKNLASEIYNPLPLVPHANIKRTSPRVAKKLIKPGANDTQQPNFMLESHNNSAVSIKDEYTDPFDAVTSGQTKNIAADGYVEPYEAEQMYRDVKQSENLDKSTVYDEPWDKTPNQDSNLFGNDAKYEEPWDNTVTLPFQEKPPQGSNLFYAKTRVTGDKHGELILEYPNHGFVSGDSSTSSSSASVAKQRMVRVDSPRHSPKYSPRSSPKLDQRLVRMNEPAQLPHESSAPLYSVPGKGSKYRPVDHRLIKAEPSLAEMRNSPVLHRSGSSKESSRTHSPAGSSRVSPNSSPLTTMVYNDPVARFNNDQNRRASSPLVHPRSFMHTKVKSLSLDVRNPQYLSQIKEKHFPKSASDDQLTHAFAINSNHSPSKGNRHLMGVREYEEPRESGYMQQYLSSIPPGVVHSRSRSYDMNYIPAVPHIKHGKSRSFDKQDTLSTRPLEPTQLWESAKVPQTHFESMQRFQHRQLELHPAEAISHRDFDPLLPLNKQSWFHGAISRDEANRRLEKEREGAYLVRNSESIPNNYSLSLRIRDDIIHMVISRTRDGHWILGEYSAPFHSVPEMIAFYAAHRLKINDVQQLSLTYPLPEDYL